MKKILIAGVAAIAFLASMAASEAEARGRRGAREGLFQRLRDRRSDRGGRLHVFQRSRGGCSTCDASDDHLNPIEPIGAPQLIDDDGGVRLADTNQE